MNDKSQRPRRPNGRRRAREMAVQGIYAHLIAGNDVALIAAQLREEPDFAEANAKLFESLLTGSLAAAEELEAVIAPCLDREVAELSPVERAILTLAACELRTHPETPYRVIINEAVELAKSFGGAEGHRYVNGVLDRLARALRPEETARR